MIVDMFGKQIEVGHTVVYPTRPGGKGPLQLGSGKVASISSFDLQVRPDPEHPSKIVSINRTDRVAIVQP